MIWFVWRQQRAEAIIFGALMVLLSLIVLKTGVDMAASYQQLGVATCIGASVSDPHCSDVLTIFQQRSGSLNTAFYVFELAPIALSLLLAAPYIQDMEQGMYRLAWTQGITRVRWLLVRVILLGAAATLASLVCSVLMTWWHGPLDRLSGASFSYISFDTEGVVPIAYTLFALGLVLFFGTLLRRTIPAMTAALVTFAAVRAGIEVLARPRYLPPIDHLWKTGSIPIGPHDWLISRGEIYRNRLGQDLSWDQVNQLCGSPSTASNLSPAALKDAYIACYNYHGLAEVVRYQPAGRYWIFQGIESALFLTLAVGLLALTVWWIRSRSA